MFRSEEEIDVFKITLVCRASKNSTPYTYTQPYFGEDPDLRVKELLKEMIFQHGFKLITVVIVRQDLSVEHVERRIRVRIGGRR